MFRREPEWARNLSWTTGDPDKWMDEIQEKIEDFDHISDTHERANNAMRVMSGFEGLRKTYRTTLTPGQIARLQSLGGLLGEKLPEDT